MKCRTVLLMSLVCLFLTAGNLMAEPLKIAYSDWPGWIAWDIGVRKGFFKKNNVDVELKWFEYMASMDAFAAGKVDAVTVTNGDALILNATGARNVMVMINDISNGNDKVVGAPGITSIKDLKGKKIGVEIGCVSHLLLINALKDNQMTDKDVTLVNVPTHQTAQVLASGDVDAIVAWQPNSGQALKSVHGSSEIYTSANAPGLIYDVLAVSLNSVMSRRADWEKVVAAWYDIVAYMKDPANYREMLEILSARVSLTPAEYEPFLKGTKILTLTEALEDFKPGDGFASIYGSSQISDDFMIENKVYEKPVNVKKCIDSSFSRKLQK